MIYQYPKNHFQISAYKKYKGWSDPKFRIDIEIIK